MGIFGRIGGMVGDFVAEHGGAEALVQQALQSAGGVEGVVAKLRDAGYGGQVQSWLGAGPNEPVTADGIARALGHGKIGEMAQQYGLSPDQVSGLLAKVLPSVIDHVSPNGVAEPHRLDGDPAP